MSDDISEVPLPPLTASNQPIVSRYFGMEYSKCKDDSKT